MRIATYNVNSVKAHITGVLAWLKEAAPEIVLLQEIKCVDEQFPRFEFEALGYNIETHGQKTYNGVAILSKHPIEDVTRGLPGFTDEQARFIEATIVPRGARPCRVAGIYVPNGNPSPGEKFDYKMRWLDALYDHVRRTLADEEPYIVAGDYNIMPEPGDCYDPVGWKDDALFRIEVRRFFRKLLSLGLTDAVRACTHAPQTYTFWDYQAGAWPKNNGLRIDHLLLSPQAADRLQAAGIDKHVRGWEKPSDHVPAWCDLRL